MDSAADHRVFLDFLAQLRAGYISRETDDLDTFRSVILAGVRDVRCLKEGVRPGDQDRSYGPWNISADLGIDMSLSESGIRAMLEEYEADHKTGMDPAVTAKLLREYTNGYPFLVSRICQLMDEGVRRRRELREAWTPAGFDEAVRLLLAEDNTLFQSLEEVLRDLPELKTPIRDILMGGTGLTWNWQQAAVSEMHMYGLIRKERNRAKIANRIFETLLLSRFLQDQAQAPEIPEAGKEQAAGC